VLLVLKFNGENEAEELMEFIDSSSCSEPTTSSPTTPIAVLAVILGKFIDVERSSSAGGLRACSKVARQPVLMCRHRLSEWITGSWSHCGLHVFEVCSASCLCAVLLCALRMPLRGLLALGAAHRVRGAEKRV
jgi:hypothetical protein